MARQKVNPPSTFAAEPIMLRTMFIISKIAAPGEEWMRALKGKLLPGNKRGQTLVEYALILAFISVVAISVLINLGTTVKGTFSKVTSNLQSAQSSH